MDDGKKRCAWISSDLMRAYHDEEWGVPLHDDRKLFEFRGFASLPRNCALACGRQSLVLEGMQAGLSWSVVLNKREAYRAAFDAFDAEKIARYGEPRIAKLLKNPGIIRNRQKVVAAIKNARAFLDVVDEEGSFASYSWAFVGGKPKVNRRRSLKDFPAKTKQSEAFSRDLRKRGFSFVGATVIYAHMQATGMVNDHVVSCFRWSEVQR